VPRTFFGFIHGHKDFRHAKAISSETRIVIAAIADDCPWGTYMGIADLLSRVEQPA
jgi:hypothetical protein